MDSIWKKEVKRKTGLPTKSETGEAPKGSDTRVHTKDSDALLQILRGAKAQNEDQEEKKETHT